MTKRKTLEEKIDAQRNLIHERGGSKNGYIVRHISNGKWSATIADEACDHYEQDKNELMRLIGLKFEEEGNAVNTASA